MSEGRDDERDGNDDVESLEDVVECLEEVADDADERVSWGDVLEKIGRRSFGPLLVLCGIVVVAPGGGDIPGVTIVMGVVVLLTAGQLVFGRDELWQPKWLRERSVKKKTFEKMTGFMEKPARWVDKVLKERLTRFTEGPATRVIGVAASVMALMTPLMEVVPFSANAAGAAWIAFGLALIANDGLFALLAFAATTGTAALLIGYVL
ncbi:MAG: exopolysaccharide biosynthesis protein [Deltaproteobacteria bacterium]|nr:exopolysaccharide biosynthesis protein [Deltaproteobacteria bacterium]